MAPIIDVQDARCRNCYRCIRNCSVKAIACLEDRTRIIGESCIYCGRCLLECPNQARSLVSELDTVKRAIAKGERLYASLAPSFVAAFPGADIMGMSAALRRLGFVHGEETAVGAERVTRAYEQLIRERKMPNIITTSCVSLNLLVEKYYPDLLGQLAPVLTPAATHARMLRQIYSNRAKVVFIGPCVAKKQERTEDRNLFAVLTFQELKDWLEQEEVSYTEPDGEGKALRNTVCRFYPAPGGIIRNLSRRERSRYECVSVDGAERCIQTLEEIRNNKLTGFFLEMNICPGGCLGGPVLQQMGVPFLRSRDVLIRSALQLNEGPATLTEGIAVNLRRTFRDHSTRPEPVEEESIRRVLAAMGKTRPEQEINCGSCGYDTCRDKAVAVLRGRADIGMCVPHMRELAESMANTVVENAPMGIVVLDRQGCVAQTNPAAGAILGLDGSAVGRPLGELLPGEHMPAGDEPLTQVVPLPDRDRVVEVTGVRVPYNGAAFLLLHDITREERLRRSRLQVVDQTAQVAREVMGRQMKIVQEIAGLLGETTADTKSALSQLLRSIDEAGEDQVV